MTSRLFPPNDLYVDLDGLLANFDRYFLECFGVPCNQDNYEPPDMWKWIREHGKFYRNLPEFDYTQSLWKSLKELHPNPIILTGIPHSIPNVADHKREWVEEHIGPDVQVIACASRNKKDFCNPGDILIDDRTKYRHLWWGRGGIFIHHTNPDQTIADFKTVLRTVPGWAC
jgi:5'(3')-deoxyribonucleotidase